MSRHPDPGFDPRIADWLEADPDRAPAEVLQTVASAIPLVAQRRAWRLSRRTLPMTRLVILGASVALLAALGIGVLTVGSRPPAPVPTPAPSAAAAVQSSPEADDPGSLDAYVAARKAVCVIAVSAAEPIKARFDPLYDPNATTAEKADALQAVREFADLADGFVAELEALEPPLDLVADHAANAAQYRDVLILIRESLALHDEGRTAEAIAVDWATNGISELITAYERQHGLSPCP